MVVWLHIYDSKCVVRIYGIATKCVICGVDIHPDIDYTCHDDSSLYVVSLVTLGALLKYGRLIHALQVQGSFHIVLPFEDDPKAPKHIITVRGLGYKLEK